MYWFMSRCHNKDILNNVIFGFKISLLRESHLITVVSMSCHGYEGLNMHTPSSKVLPIMVHDFCSPSPIPVRQQRPSSLLQCIQSLPAGGPTSPVHTAGSGAPHQSDRYIFFHHLYGGEEDKRNIF